jgi:hypothetical protein
MSNYNAKINLAKLEGFGKVTLTGQSGKPKRCVVLPIAENHLFEGKDGTYLDLSIIESANSQYGDTHFITRGKSQEEREQEKATGERLRLPILGNLKPFGREVAESQEYTYQPQTGTQQARPAQQTPQNVEQDGVDDLPF